MPKRKQDLHLYELAKRGAEARLADLVHEARLLIELFPHLKDSYDSDELPLPFILAKASGRATRSGQRGDRRMSAAARKAVSERMKKYWARRRSEQSD